jgi:DNA ligase D-like protein (predicted 3'-phosphoesterase)
MPRTDPLKEYRKKRNLKHSPEPSGRVRRSGRRLRFVVQKHAARSLHYDFRLEAGGVLKSWAVPKGPSTNPKEKRLAMPTEDHPIDYLDFEGVIPEGEYGAGSVIVWDTGTYYVQSEEEDKEIPLEKALKQGRVSIWLDGKKLHGGYSLIRMGKGAKSRWMLVKKKDEGADARRNITKSQPNSVISGKSVEEIAKER